MKNLILIFALGMIIGGCAGQPVLPDADNVKVKRQKTSDEDCKSLGQVMGRVASRDGKPEEALADLKKEATMKGANYVHVGQYSSMGTAVSGEAYQCP